MLVGLILIMVFKMNWLLPEYRPMSCRLLHARQRRAMVFSTLFRVVWLRVGDAAAGGIHRFPCSPVPVRLRLRTFKLVDQVSGRTLGVRADITPQAA